MTPNRARRAFALEHGLFGLLLAVGLSTGCKRYDPPQGAASGLYASCCGGAGTCLPEALIDSSDAARLSRDACGEALLCAPREAAGSGGYVPARCSSVAGLEGRCLPSCLPELQSQLERLPTEGCPAANHCAPCYDPITLEPTGACGLGDDPGPSDPPPALERCCGELGRCLDASLLSKDEQTRLGRDNCEAAALCVPERWLADEPVVPMSCRSIGDAEGRCLPACLPELAARADELEAAGCPAAHLCTPCFDVLSGQSTGACEIGDDPGPSEPPKVLGDCCGELGRCVPQALVPDTDQDRLGADACTDDGALCVPERWLDDGPLVPESCRATGDLEGRCLPQCLPEVADRADSLSMSTCPAGHLCTPCFDPLDGASTGACDVGDDPGPTELPATFGDCCEDRGRCVPRSLVLDLASASDTERLDKDACTDDDALCVPKRWLDEGPLVPESCRAPGDLEGRCLPQCLPDIAAQADQLSMGTCSAGHLCTPCFDPLDGESTGACDIGDDPGPADPPATFGDCCEDRGRCVPRSLVLDLASASDSDRLGADVCTEGDALCVPERWLDEGPLVPESCRAPGDLEGRCLPQCLPEIAERAGELRAESCPAGHLCAPCFDPLDGASTGACELGDDPGPVDPPRTFDTCCESEDVLLGRCIPLSLLSSEQTDQLPADSCDESSARCVPNRLIDDPDGGFEPCRAAFEAGACIPGCMLSAGEYAILSQRTCPSGMRCAPCSILAQNDVDCP